MNFQSWVSAEMSIAENTLPADLEYNLREALA